MKKKIFTLAAFYLLACTSYAQPRHELFTANYLYNHYAFKEAIEHYQKINDPISDPVVLGRIGDCYRLIKSPDKAVEYYGQAYKKKGCPDYVKLYYALSLMTLLRYPDALPVLTDYQKTHPGDRRAANLITSCRQEGKIKEISGDTYLLGFNTDGSEFGPATKSGELVFTTDNVIDHVDRKKDQWTGKYFYEIYGVNCGDNGLCEDKLRKVSHKVNTKYHDGPCAFTPDGRDMFFTRTNYTPKILANGVLPDQNDIVHLEIMTASGYDEDKLDYTEITTFPYNSKDYSNAHPAISDDGTCLFYCSDAPGGSGGTDLYVTTKDSRGQWTKPVNLGAVLNTEGDEMFPTLVGDTALYFASNGHVGMGGLDIYYTRWDKKQMIFSPPVNVGSPVNSSYDDMSYVAGNEQFYYFASNRPAEKKGDNIYSFHPQPVRKVKAPDARIFYHAIVLDQKTKLPIADPQIVFIREGTKGDTTALRTGEEFTKELQAGQVYRSYALKPDYYNNEHIISTKKFENNHAPVIFYDTIWMSKLEIGQVYKIDNIYYDYDQATIREDAKPALERLLELLKKYPSMHIQLNSHTDCRGTETYNYKLSNDRAHSVVMYLTQKGISPDRLQHKGYGETHLANKCKCEQCTEEQHQENRRTEFEIISL